jgi:hypothetical protein
MPLQPFDLICPETAAKELRICTVPTSEAGVPAGDYFLREFYCNEHGCDCRRVLVQFIPKQKEWEVAASINFGWERPRFYRKWSSDPDLWREMAGATLEPFAEQGPHSLHFLAMFEHISRDPALVAVFRRHYLLVKQTLEPPSWARM